MKAAYQESLKPTRDELFQLGMYVIQTLDSLSTGMLLEFPVDLDQKVSKKCRTGAKGVTYSLSPLFGSSGWSTTDACSNHSVKIFGSVWNTYLHPYVSERR